MNENGGNSARCAGIKGDGTRCERIVGASSEFCFAHDPARATERSANASKAASSKGSVPIKNVTRKLEKLADDVLEGTVEKGTGSVVAQILVHRGENNPSVQTLQMDIHEPSAGNITAGVFLPSCSRRPDKGSRTGAQAARARGVGGAAYRTGGFVGGQGAGRVGLKARLDKLDQRAGPLYDVVPLTDGTEATFPRGERLEAISALMEGREHPLLGCLPRLAVAEVADPSLREMAEFVVAFGGGDPEEPEGPHEE